MAQEWMQAARAHPIGTKLSPFYFAFTNLCEEYHVSDLDALFDLDMTNGEMNPDSPDIVLTDI